MEDSAVVPVDTQIWVSFHGFSFGQDSFRIEDDSGAAVEVDVRLVMKTPTDDGPREGFASLTPLANLKPSSLYTIELTYPGFEGVTQTYLHTFKTGAGVWAQPPPTTPEPTYVAMEGFENRGDDCGLEGSDAFHLLRWKLPPTQGMFRSILSVEREGEPERTIIRHFDGDESNYGEYMFIGDSSIGLEEYPCLTHTLIDVTGREVSSKNSCEPDLCVVPPLTEYGTTDYGDFIRNPGTWDAMATDCAFAGVPTPQPGEGCASTPTSPIPHAPLALGLALLGLFGRRSGANRGLK